MFDVSFSELMLIGVIALIVIGPERLPKVARTVGHLLGRAQRYVSDVKSDIQREMDLEELNSLKGQMEDAARSVKSSMQSASDSLREPLEDARKALTEASESIGNLTAIEKADEQKEAAKEAIASPPAAPPETPAQAAPAADAAGQRQAPAAAPASEHPGTPDGDTPEPDTATLPLPGFDDAAATPNQTGKPS